MRKRQGARVAEGHGRREYQGKELRLVRGRYEREKIPERNRVVPRGKDGRRMEE